MNLCLFDRGRELGAEDVVPKSTSYPETIFVIHEMVLEVILLQLGPVRRQGLVVEEVMRQIVAYISENTATEDRRCNMPVPIEHGMS